MTPMVDRLVRSQRSAKNLDPLAHMDVWDSEPEFAGGDVADHVGEPRESG